MYQIFIITRVARAAFIKLNSYVWPGLEAKQQRMTTMDIISQYKAPPEVPESV